MNENEIQVLGTSHKKRKKFYPMWWLPIIVVAIIITTFVFYRMVHPNKMYVSTIDSCLQTKTDSLLREKMFELNAISGQAIVMEVESGKVKALVGISRRDGFLQTNKNVFAVQQESGLVQGVSFMTALTSKNVHLTDSVDTKNGVLSIDGTTMKDHNWHRGGYSTISAEWALQVSSNIGIYKSIKKAFGKGQGYFEMLKNMNYGMPDSIDGIVGLKKGSFLSPKDKSWDDGDFFAWSCIGYDHAIAPIQMLTFYNAIANNGKMIKPHIFEREIEVINPQIADSASIKAMQYALEGVVSRGLGKLASSEFTKTAGTTGTFQIYSSEYEGLPNIHSVEFCGYFPADAPKYSIIVSITKPGYPASGGGMAGPVFKNIVDYMCEHFIKE